MSYPQSRLLLGISGVGSVVVLCTVALAWQLPSRWLPAEPRPMLEELTWLVGILLGYSGLCAVLDLFGGYLLPRWHGRQVPTVKLALRRWSIAVACQVTCYTGLGMLMLALSRIYGPIGGWSVLLAGMLALLAAGGILPFLYGLAVSPEQHRLLLPIRARLGDWRLDHDRLQVVDHLDPALTVSVVGLPAFETILIPRDDFRELTSDEIAACVARRVVALRTGARSLGIGIALVWNLIGFALASTLLGQGLTSLAGLVATCCGFTLWSFLGLLTLPTLSRWGTCAVDRQAVRWGVPVAALQRAQQVTAPRHAVEEHRHPLIESIFHPTPSLENRFAAANDAVDRLPAWHAARTTLFLSWAGLGLLARVVHCNAGCPELWTLLPSD